MHLNWKSNLKNLNQGYVIHVEKELPFINLVEKSCGDYSAGRFAWHLHHTWELEHPILVNGHQRLWDYVITETELLLNIKLRNLDGSDYIPKKQTEGKS